MTAKRRRAAGVSLREYAESRGITPDRAGQLARAGKLKGAARKRKGRWVVNPEKADDVLGLTEKRGDGRVSIREYASRSGVGEKAVRAWITRGKIDGAWEKDSKGRYRIDPARADELRGKGPRPAPDTRQDSPADEIPDDATKEEAERKKKIWDARTARLRHLEAAGELVPRAATQDAIFSAAKEIRERLDVVPQGLRDKLAAEDDPRAIEQLLREQLEEAQQALAAALERLSRVADEEEGQAA